MAIVETMQPALLAYIPESTGTPKVDGHALLAPRVHVRKPGSIQADAWLLHDIEPVGQGKFRISGKDPYLESPPLDIRTAQVKGVYYKLVTTSCNTPCKMQFFWKSYVLDYQSERRPFNERESYWFWLKMKDHVARFYLPFDPVNPDDILKRIRLDFAPCKNMVFRIQQAKLIGRQGKGYRRFLPTQAVFHTMAAIPERHGNELTVPWRQLLFWDRGFWIVFGVMIFTVMLIIVLFLACHLRNCRRNYGWRDLPPRYQRYGKTEE